MKARVFKSLDDYEHEFGQTLGDNGGQRTMVCYGPCGCKESDTAQQLKSNKDDYASGSLFKINSTVVSPWNNKEKATLELILKSDPDLL